MEIKLDDANIKALVGEAILQALTPENKDALIRQALDQLVTPKKDQYNPNRQPMSPLEVAFERAIANEAEKFAQELIKTNEDIQDKIKDMLAEACNRVFDKRRDDVVNKLSTAIGESFFNLR